jgi:thiol-disulfide isomerase/thioredoxin
MKRLLLFFAALTVALTSCAVPSVDQELVATFGELQGLSGDALPPMVGNPGGDMDPALGMEAPTIRGLDAAGNEVITTFDAPVTVVLFLAHWCPTCQAEVSKMGGWDPDDLNADIFTVTSFSSRLRPNYPPQNWLGRSNWKWPVVLDWEDSDQAAAAYGISIVPGWVLVDDDGRVLRRGTGLIESVKEFNEIVDPYLPAD